MIRLYQGILVPVLESECQEVKLKGILLVQEYYRNSSEFNLINIIEFSKYFFEDEFLLV